VALPTGGGNHFDINRPHFEQVISHMSLMRSRRSNELDALEENDPLQIVSMCPLSNGLGFVVGENFAGGGLTASRLSFLVSEPVCHS
jgi:hypothetical protein